MEVPILKQGRFLIATIQAALSDADLLHLRRALIDKVIHFRSNGVIIDVTALDVMDSFATRTLRDITNMIRLRGADTVIVGIQPEVAFAMVQLLGLTMEDVATALDLEEGLAHLQLRATGKSLRANGCTTRYRGSDPLRRRYRIGAATGKIIGHGNWVAAQRTPP